MRMEQIVDHKSVDDPDHKTSKIGESIDRVWWSKEPSTKHTWQRTHHLSRRPLVKNYDKRNFVVSSRYLKRICNATREQWEELRVDIQTPKPILVMRRNSAMSLKKRQTQWSIRKSGRWWRWEKIRRRKWKRNLKFYGWIRQKRRICNGKHC